MAVIAEDVEVEVFGLQGIDEQGIVAQAVGDEMEPGVVACRGVEPQGTRSVNFLALVAPLEVDAVTHELCSYFQQMHSDFVVLAAAAQSVGSSHWILGAVALDAVGIAAKDAAMEAGTECLE